MVYTITARLACIVTFRFCTSCTISPPCSFALFWHALLFCCYCEQMGVRNIAVFKVWSLLWPPWFDRWKPVSPIKTFDDVITLTCKPVRSPPLITIYTCMLSDMHTFTCKAPVLMNRPHSNRLLFFVQVQRRPCSWAGYQPPFIFMLEAWDRYQSVSWLANRPITA